MQFSDNEEFVINVVHCKKVPSSHPIYRGFPLGNPFPMYEESERDKVCDLFEEYFRKKVAQKDPTIMNELGRMVEKAFMNGGIELGCYCAPRRCHGNTIKSFLELVLNGDGDIFIDT